MNLIIAGKTVRNIDGLYCLNDLSDEELNRAMIWINPPNTKTFEFYLGQYRHDCHSRKHVELDYLTNWSLTGPLLVKHGISLDVINNNGFISCEATDDTGFQALDLNPLRAICECILMIEIAND